MNTIVILEFPSNLGLQEKEAFHEPGVKKLAHYLKISGFHQLINAKHVYRIEPPAYSMKLDEASGVRNADKIGQYAQEQAALLEEVLAKKEFPVVLGGDCSILIGTMLGLKQTGAYGLFFLDGHTDFIPPELSQTAGAAGMDLAIVAGYGHDKLTNLANQKPYVQESHIWCVGNRTYDTSYIKPIEASAIHYLDLLALRAFGLKKCATAFLNVVKQERLDGFWLHLDVDVLNDSLMPAVDSRQPDGLSYDELNELLFILLSDERSTGLEITILDPELDPEGEYTKTFVNNFCAVFNEASSKRIQ